eukprot:TRINITY_DN2811_c0_g1_i7.p2 TRINITY_DN2811_c0_g1~~TRINITY_DN2811_c0_g1_i7.p2  ORF type:complete len:210 (-),score=50.42 TRINITY_DN2811_c0_g1_i7:53-682(-)
MRAGTPEQQSMTALILLICGGVIFCVSAGLSWDIYYAYMIPGIVLGIIAMGLSIAAVIVARVNQRTQQLAITAHVLAIITIILELVMVIVSAAVWWVPYVAGVADAVGAIQLFIAFYGWLMARRHFIVVQPSVGVAVAPQGGVVYAQPGVTVGQPGVVYAQPGMAVQPGVVYAQPPQPGVVYAQPQPGVAYAQPQPGVAYAQPPGGYPV